MKSFAQLALGVNLLLLSSLSGMAAAQDPALAVPGSLAGALAFDEALAWKGLSQFNAEGATAGLWANPSMTTRARLQTPGLDLSAASEVRFRVHNGEAVERKLAFVIFANSASTPQEDYLVAQVSLSGAGWQDVRIPMASFRAMHAPDLGNVTALLFASTGYGLGDAGPSAVPLRFDGMSFGTKDPSKAGTAAGSSPATATKVPPKERYAPKAAAAAPSEEDDAPASAAAPVSSGGAVPAGFEAVLGFDDVSAWKGMTPDSGDKKEGSGCGVWDTTTEARARTRKFPADLSSARAIVFWMHADAPGQTVALAFRAENDETTEGPDYYFFHVKAEKQGWQEVRLPLATARVARSPLGWNKIGEVTFAADGYGLKKGGPMGTLKFDGMRFEQ